MGTQEEASKKSVHRVPPAMNWLYPRLTILLALLGVAELGLAIVSSSAGDFNIWTHMAAISGFFTCAVCAWMWRQQILDARDNQRQH
jgi:hypothetical protein